MIGKGQEKNENHPKKSGITDHKGRNLGTTPETYALGPAMLFCDVTI